MPADREEVDQGRFATIRCMALLARFRRTVEKIDAPSLERVFGTHDKEALLLDQVLEYSRSVSQMVRGDTDVGADGMLHQNLWVVPEVRREQPFQGWTDAIND